MNISLENRSVGFTEQRDPCPIRLKRALLQSTLGYVVFSVYCQHCASDAHRFGRGPKTRGPMVYVIESKITKLHCYYLNGLLYFEVKFAFRSYKNLSCDTVYVFPLFLVTFNTGYPICSVQVSIKCLTRLQLPCAQLSYKNNYDTLHEKPFVCILD